MYASGHKDQGVCTLERQRGLRVALSPNIRGCNFSQSACEPWNSGGVHNQDI